MADRFLAPAPRGTRVPLHDHHLVPTRRYIRRCGEPEPPPSVSLLLAPSPSPSFARHGQGRAWTAAATKGAAHTPTSHAVPHLNAPSPATQHATGPLP
jgi:hypothetical protein